VSSTALTLVVIPAIYALIKGFGLSQIGEVKQELEGTIHAAP
jgi:Cu(I)/Ag(I) efflux system membrane protein CusA/SilA